MNNCIATTIRHLLEAEGWFDDANELLIYFCDIHGYEKALEYAIKIDDLVNFINPHLTEELQVLIKFLEFKGAKNILLAMSSTTITNERLLS